MNPEAEFEDILRINPQADTSSWEEEIDHAQRVASRQLYGLTPTGDEVKIVEGR